MKYAIQYNNGKYSCGPIALLNALKHQGHPATRKHLPWLAKLLNSEGGTRYQDFDRVGRQLGALKRLYKLSEVQIVKYLTWCDAIVLFIGMWKKEPFDVAGHFVTLAGLHCNKDERLYYVCNTIGGRVWQTWEELGGSYIDQGYDYIEIRKAWRVPLEGKPLPFDH